MRTQWKPSRVAYEANTHGAGPEQPPAALAPPPVTSNWFAYESNIHGTGPEQPPAALAPSPVSPNWFAYESNIHGTDPERGARRTRLPAAALRGSEQTFDDLH
jgi:hypothetical protein